MDLPLAICQASHSALLWSAVVDMWALPFTAEHHEATCIAPIENKAFAGTNHQQLGDDEHWRTRYSPQLAGSWHHWRAASAALSISGVSIKRISSI